RTEGLAKAEVTLVCEVGERADGDRHSLETGGHFACAVGRAGIEHDDTLRARKRREAAGNVTLFVERQHQGAEPDGASGGPGPVTSPFRVRVPTDRAGFPATTHQGATSRTATERAPTTAPSPTVTFGPMNASVQTQASSPIEIGGLSSGKSRRR